MRCTNASVIVSMQLLLETLKKMTLRVFTERVFLLGSVGGRTSPIFWTVELYVINLLKISTRFGLFLNVNDKYTPIMEFVEATSMRAVSAGLGYTGYKLMPITDADDHQVASNQHFTSCQ